MIFIPFFLIMVAPTVMTLYTKGDAAPRITAWGQSILAMIAFNFTLSIRYPGLGSALSCRSSSPSVSVSRRSW